MRPPCDRKVGTKTDLFKTNRSHRCVPCANSNWAPFPFYYSSLTFPCAPKSGRSEVSRRTLKDMKFNTTTWQDRTTQEEMCSTTSWIYELPFWCLWVIVVQLFIEPSKGYHQAFSIKYWYKSRGCKERGRSEKMSLEDLREITAPARVTVAIQDITKGKRGKDNLRS